MKLEDLRAIAARRVQTNFGLHLKAHLVETYKVDRLSDLPESKFEELADWLRDANNFTEDKKNPPEERPPSINKSFFRDEKPLLVYDFHRKTFAKDNDPITPEEARQYAATDPKWEHYRYSDFFHVMLSEYDKEQAMKRAQEKLRQLCNVLGSVGEAAQLATAALDELNLALLKAAPETNPA